MGNQVEPLLPGCYYHIYNRGINSGHIFNETENYNHFLRLMAKYIEPVCEIYAWALMKNHFHLLVYIKPEIELQRISYSVEKVPKNVNATQQFSNWFNAYSKAYNKRYNRTGSLFEKTFERKLVSSEKYFQNLIYYIHWNPVKHYIVEHPLDYPWSSYLSILSSKPTKLKREKIVQVYQSIDHFKKYHDQEQDLSNIEDLMIE